MSKTVTLSFAIPIEMSIEMSLHMEIKKMNRSQLLKAAIREFLDSQKEKENMPKVVNEIRKEITEIKKLLCKNR